jgi:hypothetical protein
MKRTQTQRGKAVGHILRPSCTVKAFEDNCLLGPRPNAVDRDSPVAGAP